MKTTVLIYAVIISLFISCKQADAEAVSSEMSIQTVKLPRKEMRSDYDKKEDSNTIVRAASLSNHQEEEETIETKIIKLGDLRFQTDDLEKTYNQIQAAVKNIMLQLKMIHKTMVITNFPEGLTSEFQMKTLMILSQKFRKALPILNEKTFHQKTSPRNMLMLFLELKQKRY